MMFMFTGLGASVPFHGAAAPEFFAVNHNQRHRRVRSCVGIHSNDGGERLEQVV